MGRFGQIAGPLNAGALLGAGWTADPDHDGHRLRRIDRSGFRRVVQCVVSSGGMWDGVAAEDATAKGPMPV